MDLQTTGSQQERVTLQSCYLTLRNLANAASPLQVFTASESKQQSGCCWLSPVPTGHCHLSIAITCHHSHSGPSLHRVQIHFHKPVQSSLDGTETVFGVSAIVTYSKNWATAAPPPPTLAQLPILHTHTSQYLALKLPTLHIFISSYTQVPRD